MFVEILLAMWMSVEGHYYRLKLSANSWVHGEGLGKPHCRFASKLLAGHRHGYSITRICGEMAAWPNVWVPHRTYLAQKLREVLALVLDSQQLAVHRLGRV